MPKQAFDMWGVAKKYIVYLTLNWRIFQNKTYTYKEVFWEVRAFIPLVTTDKKEKNKLFKNKICIWYQN